MKTTPLLILALGLALPLMAGSPAAGPPRAIVVGSDHVDFGRYPAWQRKDAAYELRNDGETPLRLISIRKNCGCAEAKADRMELPPGESAKVTAVILADSIHGPYSKNVVVETDDPERRFVTFVLAGQAVPVATVKPMPVLYAGRLPTGQAWKQEFLIERGPDTKELRLGEPEAKCNYPVTTKLEPLPDGALRLTIEATPEQPVGDLSCVVKLPVESPAGWGPVQITVAAKVGLEFRAVPERMFLTAADGKDAEKTFSLRLLSPGVEALDPKAITWEAPAGARFRIGAVTGNTVPVTMTYGEELIAALRSPEPPRIVFRHPGAEPAALYLILK